PAIGEQDRLLTPRNRYRRALNAVSRRTCPCRGGADGTSPPRSRLQSAGARAPRRRSQRVSAARCPCSALAPAVVALGPRLGDGLGAATRYRPLDLPARVLARG